MAIITDLPWVNKTTGETHRGFYMDKWLAQNLERIPAHLKKGWDVVAIVSGSGLVRVGKSTLAMQMAAYVDWCLSGGKMLWDEDGRVKGIIPPNKPLRFSLENVVFSPEDLIKVTKEKGARAKYNVFVLDEGREGLLGARVMESVNKRFEDYFQTCGVYNNFIVIVLPDFFKLAEQYCVNRSMFLINCFHKNYERGYFSFFNTLQKERLYFFGKKRLGISARYGAASRNFWGRFSKWLPFNEDQYNTKKKAAIGKAKWSKFDVAQMRQRDLLNYLVYKNTNFTVSDISEKMAEVGAPEFTTGLVERSLRNAKRILDNEKYIVDEDEEPGQPIESDVTFSDDEEGELEIIKNPRAGMASYNKEYDNTDLSTKDFVRPGENVEETDEDEEIDESLNTRKEITTADDPYGDDGITQDKYNIAPRKNAAPIIKNPDAEPLPTPNPKKTNKIPGIPLEYVEDLNAQALKVLKEAEKMEMGLKIEELTKPEQKTPKKFKKELDQI